MTTDRRRFLQAGLGGLAGLASVPLWGAEASRLPTEKLTDRVTLITGAPGNVVALASTDGVVLVDSGSAALAGAVQASLGGARVQTLFNTHYHADQTGGNALFGAAGAAIRAHVITRQWLATDYYVPADDRWVKALPAVALPTVSLCVRPRCQCAGRGGCGFPIARSGARLVCGWLAWRPRRCDG